MPRYDFRCPHGHVTELVCGMADVPSTTTCTGHHFHTVDLMTRDVVPVADLGQPLADLDAYACTATAARIFQSPAAIHFKGSGFYSTDVKGRLERKRRPNAADDLPAGDGNTHAIARSW